MIINKNSWHYRFLKFADASFKEPKSLCPYVRQIVIKAIFCSFLVFIMGFFFVVVGTSVLAKFAVPVGLAYWVGGFALGAAIVAVAIGAIVGGIFGLMFLTEKYKERKSEKRTAEMKKRMEAGLDPEPPKTLMREWIDAKHDKICPTLEFTNDKS